MRLKDRTRRRSQPLDVWGCVWRLRYFGSSLRLRLHDTIYTYPRCIVVLIHHPTCHTYPRVVMSMVHHRLVAPILKESSACSF